MNLENYNEAISYADTAFSNDNYELALECYKKALAENPDDLYALSRAGTVCVPLDKYDESFGFFEKALKIDPENGDNYYNMGNAYFFHADFGKSLEMYTEAEKRGCSEDVAPKLYYQLAMLCSVRQDVKGALINFKKYEEADKTNVAALDPSVISEKIKLYMFAEDYENAEKCAAQWVAVAPGDIRSYMVYFSIQMANSDLDGAEKTITDAEKYADLTPDDEISVAVNKAALYTAKGDLNNEEAAEYQQKAYDILTGLRGSNKYDEEKKREISLTLAELCVKMGRFDEAIEAAKTVIPPSELRKVEVAAAAPSDAGADLTDAEVDNMLASDIDAIDAKKSSGELSDEIGEYAEVYYDEDGNPVRQYDDEVLNGSTIDGSASKADTEDNASAPASEKAAEVDNDRVYFLLLSCYAAKEDFKEALKIASYIKHSDNDYYAYFGRYTEAYAMKKLGMPEASKKYDEGIAFFRSRMLKSSGNNYAVIFRARMYAEIGKYAKAEEMANLLTEADKNGMMEYISECKNENPAQ